MLKKENIVVFDFDGTLSASDSSLEFGYYCFKHSLRPWFFLPVFILGCFMCNFRKYGKIGRQIMRCFLTPKMVREFVPNVIAEHRKRRFQWAKTRVATEHKNGNICVLISAGPDYLVPKLVDDMKFDAILTSEMDDEKPWKYNFACWGPNKVVALDNWAKKNKIIPHVVRSYGDSPGDKYMMDIADTAIWIDKKTGNIKK